jgi:DNA invertase Pin-like site-specific DNA recombinase
MTNKLTVEHLQRRAIVYVRQSTPAQVLLHKESRLRQYKLADYAQQLGFTEVETIDDDLGRSGSGLVQRPGFQRLVAEVCAGSVAAVFCLEASRLARNGRDWHHLIDLCALVGALLIDPEGIYDPRLSNDRLLLGLRGSMSEFELNVLRQRSLGAIRQKAQRGEYRFRLPVGFFWTEDSKIELDSDLRVQNAIRLVLRKFEELGSARQVFLWCRAENITLPSIGYRGNRNADWIVPRKHTILSMLKNPCYAGAYAYGRTESRTVVDAGRARKTEGHKKPLKDCIVLLRDHHPGYIFWDEFERNQKLLARNAHMNSRMSVQAGRGGRSLLAGKLRCRRCGHMLGVHYLGAKRQVVRYQCLNEMNQCISFGGTRPEQAVSSEILKVVQPYAIDAALQATDQIRQQQDGRLRALEMELEQAKYEARLAARRYESVDPDNRLVASELESRWNATLKHIQHLEDDLDRAKTRSTTAPTVGRDQLLWLADNLPAIWDAPATDARLRQRIVGILIHEIVVDVDDETSQVILVVHWMGGRHSEIQVAKQKSGQNSRCTPSKAIDVIRQMASFYHDRDIALTLNRLRIKTGTGETWNEARIRAARSHQNIPCYKAEEMDRSTVLSQEAAARQLGVSATLIRRLVELNILPAAQILPGAPWQIKAADLSSSTVIQAALKLKRRESLATRPAAEESTLFVCLDSE